jgi:hypothetical protein
LGENYNKMESTLGEEVEPEFKVFGYCRWRMLMAKAWSLASLKEVSLGLASNGRGAFETTMNVTWFSLAHKY